MDNPFPSKQRIIYKFMYLLVARVLKFIYNIINPWQIPNSEIHCQENMIRKDMVYVDHPPPNFNLYLQFNLDHVLSAFVQDFPPSPPPPGILQPFLPVYLPRNTAIMRPDAVKTAHKRQQGFNFDALSRERFSALKCAFVVWSWIY